MAAEIGCLWHKARPAEGSCTADLTQQETTTENRPCGCLSVVETQFSVEICS